MTSYVAVIDYGMGNLHSVASALEHAGASRVVVSHDPDIIAQADRVVFPGVGAIQDCMAEINRLGCDQLLKAVLASANQPVLAICVGMQALLDHSEENGGVDTLGIIPGRVNYFGKGLQDGQGQRLKVPHMGWNEAIFKAESPLTAGLNAQGEPFYFVHSYRVVQTDPALVWCETDYAGRFVSGVRRGRVLATQFHPEKSQVKGLQLYRNFLTLADR